MSKDIHVILDGWDYDPEKVKARWIKNDNGRTVAQLRLDLGVLQMEVENRPDGTTPRGFSSLLDYYQELEASGGMEHPGLDLNDEACAELQQEAVQYYYRYLAFYALGYLDGVIADTEHTLGIFRFVAEHAIDDDLVWQFVQFYPYVRMMNARSLAEKSLERKEFDLAVTLLEQGIEDIQDFWDEYGDPDEEYMGDEALVLAQMLENIMKRRPKSKTDQLTEDLDRAIELENYEKAAVLRDALKRLQQPVKPRKKS